MLTTEQLLQKRFKFIFPYPGGHWEIGEVFELCGNKCYATEGMSHLIMHESILMAYPAIFQPLPWWSDREPEQVEGLYIKCRDGRVGQINKHVHSDNGTASLAFFKFDAEDQVGHYYYNMHPEIITLADYEQYNQQKGTGKQIDIDGRMSYAAKILKNEGYTIRQIAELLGFKHPGSVFNLLNK